MLWLCFVHHAVHPSHSPACLVQVLSHAMALLCILRCTFPICTSLPGPGIALCHACALFTGLWGFEMHRVALPKCKHISCACSVHCSVHCMHQSAWTSSSILYAAVVHHALTCHACPLCMCTSAMLDWFMLVTGNDCASLRHPCVSCMLLLDIAILVTGTQRLTHPLSLHHGKPLTTCILLYRAGPVNLQTPMW